jgi:peptide chain release factor 3
MNPDSPVASHIARQVAKRRTFAIISHPDAGKTTLTEKLLLFGGAILMAGTVKARKSARHATSDWMEVEKQRGISVTSSVMQFDYGGHTINLLDTPGHQDFSEDTYRVLTAVDAAVMVIDAAKGVEAQTIKLLEVCRLRNTPIITFVNKLDREVREPMELLEEIESVLNIDCAPITWPIGMGKTFRGVWHLLHDRLMRFKPGEEHAGGETELIEGIQPEARRALPAGDGPAARGRRADPGASVPFDITAFLAGSRARCSSAPASTTSACARSCRRWSSGRRRRSRATAAAAHGAAGRSAVLRLRLQDPGQHGPEAPRPHRLLPRLLRPLHAGHESQPPQDGEGDEARQRADLHGQRARGERGRRGRRHHRHPQPRPVADRRHAHRGRGARLQGHPVLRAGLFRVARPRDPFKSKQLEKGLQELGEEGAIQVFQATINNNLLLGAVGVLQFEIVAQRLATEYKVDALYDAASISTARWLTCPSVMACLSFVRAVVPALVERFTAFSLVNGLWFCMPSSKSRRKLPTEN